VLVVEVDVIYAKSLQREVALFSDVFRVTARSFHSEPKFGGNEDLAALVGVEAEPGWVFSCLG
jgi:hypothetical protein